MCAAGYSAEDVADALAKFDRLKHVPWPCVRELCFEVGLSLVTDHSGRVFKRKGSAACSLKDVSMNREVTCMHVGVKP